MSLNQSFISDLTAKKCYYGNESSEKQHYICDEL